MATTWDLQEKSGSLSGGWQYDEANLLYDSLIDPDTGNPVYYDGLGLYDAWALITKSI
jgi:hypothetical protein